MVCKREKPSKIEILIMGALIVFLGGCSGGTGIESVDDLLGVDSTRSMQQEIMAALAVAQSRQPGTGSVHKVVGPSGGTLTDPSGGHTLSIPAGALDSEVEIRMTVETATADQFNGLAPATPRVRFAPHGLDFKKPVVLKLKAPRTGDTLKDRMTALYYIDEDTGLTERLDTSRQGDIISARINHFSLYAGLYLRIEDVVADRITSVTEIQNIALEFEAYLQGFSAAYEREYFYNLYQPTLLPFLNKVAEVYMPGVNPIMASFPTDDFDVDGLNNNVDPFPADPSNSGDVSAPVVLGANPSGSGVAIGPGSIQIQFDEQVSEASLEYAGYLSDGNAEYLLTFDSLDVSGQIATFRYDYSLNSNADYDVVLRGVKDLVNNRMTDQVVTSFSTVDESAPRITGISPSGFNVDPASTSFSLTFNESMDPATIAGLAFYGANQPSISFAGLSPDGRTATFSLGSALADGQFFILDIPSGIQDAAGNELAVGPEMYGFKTRDVTPPQAYLVSPTGSNVNPDAPPQIRIAFSEPINPSGFDSLVSLEGGASAPALSFVGMNSVDTEAYFNITGALDQEEEYTVRIAPGYADNYGNSQASELTFNFSSGDTVAPIVENVWPTGTGISLTPSTVRVQFNEDMHPGSFPGNATLVADDGTNVALAFISYSSYNNQAYYQVNAPLQEYTEYTLSLASGIQDESGNGLTGTTDYTFRTLSTSEPHIVDYEFNSCPAQNKVNVKVTYDRAMDPSTVDPTRNYELQHYYSVYTTQDAYGHYPGCSDQVPRPNPDFVACVAAANDAGLYHLLPLCYVYPPQKMDTVYYEPCPITKHWGRGESFSLTYAGVEDGGQTLVFQGYGTPAASSLVGRDRILFGSHWIPVEDLNGTQNNSRVYFIRDAGQIGNVNYGNSCL